MLRKLAILLAVCRGLSVVAMFWVLTIPATVPASALGPHTPESSPTAGPCSMPAAVRHATRRRARRTRRGWAAASALKSPFGTFYVPNISPDPKDGIGNWSEAQFVTAMTKGTSPGGEHYYPAFPYGSYHLMPRR